MLEPLVTSGPWPLAYCYPSWQAGRFEPFRFLWSGLGTCVAVATFSMITRGLRGQSGFLSRATTWRWRCGGGGGNKWHTPLFQFVTLASEQSCVRGHCSSSLFVSSRVHLSEGIANLSASASHETVPLCISARVSIGNGMRPGSQLYTTDISAI